MPPASLTSRDNPWLASDNLCYVVKDCTVINLVNKPCEFSFLQLLS
jgi:hypothetical protein